MAMTVLVVGGAGYIGSHTVWRLEEHGHDVVVLDNLSEGHREAIQGELVEGRCGDRTVTDAILGGDRTIDAVMHFAACCYVGESVEDPGKYYRNNVVETLSLLDAMRAHGVTRFVFSSTCATYGDPVRVPMDETHPQHPINPYGESKLVVERILRDYCRAYDLAAVSLRYFNASGADPRGDIGEDHAPETHLIPLAIQVALGQREKLLVFGDDYETRDGTCIRDYIHVNDLAEAHILALTHEAGQPGFHAFNLGTGTGSSVLEVIQAVERVSGRPVTHERVARRAGDPPQLVSAGGRAQTELGWTPEFADLTGVVETAWTWHSTHPDGYAS